MAILFPALGVQAVLYTWADKNPESMRAWYQVQKEARWPAAVSRGFVDCGGRADKPTLRQTNMEPEKVAF